MLWFNTCASYKHNKRNIAESLENDHFRKGRSDLLIVMGKVCMVGMGNL